MTSRSTTASSCSRTLEPGNAEQIAAAVMDSLIGSRPVDDDTAVLVDRPWSGSERTLRDYSSSRNSLRRWLRIGWRSLASVFASIWRIRSRVTLKYLPTSSSVRA